MRRGIVTTVLWAGIGLSAYADPNGPPREERGERGRPKGDMFAHMLRGLDQDKSGSISFEEFSAGEKVSKLSEEHREGLFRRLDKDGDGEIRRDEIPRGRGEGGRGEGGHRKLDLDGDGRVSFAEFQKNPRVANLPEEQQKEIFQRMDRNGDEFIGPGDGRGPRPEGGPGGPRRGAPKSLASLDRDDDGKVSFEEFRSGPRMKDQDEDAQEDAFERLDRDGNGVLEGEELKAPRGPRPERGDHSDGPQPEKGERGRPPGAGLGKE